MLSDVEQMPCRTIEVLEVRIAPAFSAVIDPSMLDGATGFALNGIDGLIGTDRGDYSGRSVSRAGDINGDGLDDFIIGADFADFGTAPRTGEIYIVFGKDGSFPARLDLSTLDGTNGFVLYGTEAEAIAGFPVSNAGDVNGDGIDDIIIGSYKADNGAQTDVGAAFVIFGSTTPFAPRVALQSVDGANGFRITGVNSGDYLGSSVSDAGDINGDGFDDIVIGARGADIDNPLNEGAAYVVFGKGTPFPASISVNGLNGTNGFRVQGTAPNDLLGLSVASAGDINNDGLADIILGAPNADVGAAADAGVAYVLYGSTSPYPSSISASSISGTTGFQINGANGGDNLGYSVSRAGDVNRDGVADLIVGARGLDSSILPDTGGAFVIFGTNSATREALDVSQITSAKGFRIEGEFSGDAFGFIVSDAGDINGDGFGDVIVGAFSNDLFLSEGNFRRDVGAAYVIFGKSSPFESPVRVFELDGNNGFKFTSDVAGDYAGAWVSGAGDINGDGIDDVIISAPRSDPDGRMQAGITYAIFGQAAPGSIDISDDGKTVTVIDLEGNTVIVETNKGALESDNFIFSADGRIQTIQLGGDQRFQGANISVRSDAPGGADVDLIDATNVDLGNVKVSGNLGRIIVGDNDPQKVAIKSLTVGSLGTTDVVDEPLLSEFFGSVNKLKVKGDVRGAAVEVDGTLGRVAIDGDLTGELSSGAILLEAILEGRGADPRVGGGTPVGAFNANAVGTFNVGGDMNGGSVTSGGDIGNVNVGEDLHGGAVAASGQIKRVKIVGKLIGDDPATPALIAALAKVDSTKPAGAVALNTMLVRGDVENALVLLGYQKQPPQDDGADRYLARNPDASAGKVTVNGDWSASSLVAGIFDTTHDGFGQNDAPIAGDQTANILGRIASVVIKGTATGSAAPGDHYGITAEKIGKLSINGDKIALSGSQNDNILLDANNNDFRAVEV
jgi:hypothetical protein